MSVREENRRWLAQWIDRVNPEETAKVFRCLTGDEQGERRRIYEDSVLERAAEIQERRKFEDRILAEAEAVRRARNG